jgi:hypothetical protein
VALGEEVCLEPFEPADHLVREALDLGEAARDRRCFFAEAVPQGAADGVRKDDLKLVGGLREGFDLQAGAIKRGCDVGWERIAIFHDLDGNVAVG